MDKYLKICAKVWKREDWRGWSMSKGSFGLELHGERRWRMRGRGRAKRKASKGRAER